MAILALMPFGVSFYAAAYQPPPLAQRPLKINLGDTAMLLGYDLRVNGQLLPHLQPVEPGTRLELSTVLAVDRPRRRAPRAVQAVRATREHRRAELGLRRRGESPRAHAGWLHLSQRHAPPGPSRTAAGRLSDRSRPLRRRAPGRRAQHGAGGAASDSGVDPGRAGPGQARWRLRRSSPERRHDVRPARQTRVVRPSDRAERPPLCAVAGPGHDSGRRGDARPSPPCRPARRSRSICSGARSRITPASSSST